jgi:hypothetical protein
MVPSSLMECTQKSRSDVISAMCSFLAALACHASNGVVACFARANVGGFTLRASALLFRREARILSGC